MYENSIKNNLIIVSLCTFLYLLSPKTDISVFAEQEKAKPIKTLSWTIQSWAIQKVQTSRTQTVSWTVQKKWLDIYWKNDSKSNTWSKTWDCNAECKIKTLVEMGMVEELANSLVYTCKEKAKDPRKCIIIWASILTSESGMGKRCKAFSCYWIKSKWYKSHQEATEDWVNKLNKFWYKASNSSFFYPSINQKSPSRYCVSEHSSWSAVGCPNGQKNAQAVWSKLDKLF